MIRARVRLSFALAVALTNVVIAQESSPKSDLKSTPNANQVLDLLIEQNQRLEKQNQQIEDQNQQLENQNQQLEKQNQQLMEQIKILTGTGARHANVTEPLANPASAQATAGVKVEQNGQSSSRTQSNDDDKTLLPESSEGNAAQT